MSSNNAKQFRVYPEDHEKIAGFMAENEIGSNSEFMHFVAENLSKIGATPPTDGDVAENKPRMFRVYPEDHEKIAGFMAEKDIGSNSEFMHFIAENLSRIGTDPTEASDAPTEPPDGNGGNENLRQGATEGTSPDGSADGVLIHGKFYPTLFPDETWEPEDRRYYFDWIYDNMKPRLYYDLVDVFNGMRIWKTDHEGNPKEKTPYGYFTNKYLMWHTWPVYPELWPNLPSQEVIFPECQDPEYQKALRQRHHDPFANTELRHRDKHYM